MTRGANWRRRLALHTPRLLLRPFRMGDAPMVQRLAGAREIADTTLNVPHPYLDGMAETWITSHADAWDRQEMAAFAITASKDGLIGAISLRLDSTHRRAELGYWVGRPFWNRGYATEAVRAVMKFGFDTLGLNRIYAQYLRRNPASGRVLQKVGMQYEGTLRQHVIKWDQSEDLVVHGILRTDPQPSE